MSQVAQETLPSSVILETDLSESLNTKEMPNVASWLSDALVIQKLDSHFKGFGSTYAPETNTTNFLVAVSPEVASVELLVVSAGSSESADPVVIPMSSHQSVEGGFGISLKGLEPGSRYSYRLKDELGNVIVERASDPYALAETLFVWSNSPDGYISRMKRVMAEMVGESASADQILQAVFNERREEFLAKVGDGPKSTDYDAPWSIVIDKSRLLSNSEMQKAQPHGIGERVICKFHPLHTIGVPEQFISPEFWEHRGKMEMLLDPQFRNYLKRYWNAVEFFPLNAVVPCAELVAVGRAPVWGYMPSQGFALNPEYFSTKDPHQQMLTMQKIVNALKDDGFSVIMDLVPFHNGEKEATGPRYSLRALNEKKYFLFNQDGRDVNVTGCGNTFNVHDSEIQQLIFKQSEHVINTFGVDRRLDQAAVAHLPKGQLSGYDADAEFANYLYGLGPCIIEGGHSHGFYFRDAAALRSIKNVSYKNFLERNLTDMITYGHKVDIYSNESWLSTRAFSRAGSVGGFHAEQRIQPLNDNRGVSVFPHDGATPFDRAEKYALLKLAMQSSDTKFKELASSVTKERNSGESRHVNLENLLKYAREHHSKALMDARINSAQMLMASQYLNPGDILTVFGDQLCRSQNGNVNAFDRVDYLTQSGSLSTDKRISEAQESMSMLVHRLLTLRDKYDFVFENINIFDGKKSSTSRPEFVTRLEWYGKDGTNIADAKAWQRAKGAAVRDFIGVVYQSDVRASDGFGYHSSLYVAESGLPRAFKLPPLADGHVWRYLLDSVDPSIPSGQRFAAGDRFRLNQPGIAVFESCPVD